VSAAVLCVLVGCAGRPLALPEAGGDGGTVDLQSIDANPCPQPAPVPLAQCANEGLECPFSGCGGFCVCQTGQWQCFPGLCQ